MPTRLLAVLTALLLFVTACGDDGGGDGSTAADDGGNDESSVDLPDLSGESIEVAAVWTGTEQDRFTAVLDAFSEATGAEVTFTSTGDDIAATLTPRISAGEAPDVAMLPQPGLIRDFAQQGALVDIEPAVGEQLDASFNPAWRDLGTVDGTLYGLFFKAANKSTWWYNTTVFENAGIEPPEDWDGLIEGLQTVSDSGVTPVSIGADVGWPLTDWFENVYVRTAGGEMYDQLAAHEIPWTDPSVTDAMTTLADIWGEDDFLAGGRTGALQADFPTSVTQVFTDPPEGGSVMEGDFVAGVISGDTEAVVGEDADFFPFPGIDGSEEAAIVGGDAAVLMQDSEAGQAFIRFLASPEAAQAWAELGGFISPNEDLDTSVYPTEIEQRLAEQVVSAETLRFDMSDLQPSAFGATAGQGMWSGFTDLLANPDDGDAVAAQLEREAVRAFGG
jgi:ABC-type glycerol-3-phosphate transport system substrate-binding protein